MCEMKLGHLRQTTHEFWYLESIMGQRNQPMLCADTTARSCSVECHLVNASGTVFSSKQRALRVDVSEKKTICTVMDNPGR